jgi:alkanesulfonate monooxygenase SsuD/methylene tetrahydromethanopterin reductase-like flavin-dependent oxidoreductase (luciferase family)
MAISLLYRGRLVPVPPVETAVRFLAGQGGSALPAGRRLIVGSPSTVRDGIEAVAREYGAEEVLIVTITYDHAARRRSYELIAEEFGLPRAGSG